MNTFLILHAFIVNVKRSAGWIDLLVNPAVARAEFKVDILALAEFCL